MDVSEPKRLSKKQQKLIWLVGFVLVAFSVAAFILVSKKQAEDKRLAAREAKQEKLVLEKLDDLEQDSTLLGDDIINRTLIVFSDFNCQECSDFANGVLRDLVVAPGDVTGTGSPIRIDFRTTSPESDKVAYGMYAAGEQGRAWQFIFNFYKQDPSFPVSYEQIKNIAIESGVEDINKWEEDYKSPAWKTKIKAIQDQARSQGLLQTPRVVIIDPSGEFRITKLGLNSTVKDFAREIQNQDASGTITKKEFSQVKDGLGKMEVLGIYGPSKIETNDPESGEIPDSCLYYLDPDIASPSFYYELCFSQDKLKSKKKVNRKPIDKLVE